MKIIEPVTFTPDEPVEVVTGKKVDIYESYTFSRPLLTEDIIASELVTGGMNQACAIFASMASVPLAAITKLPPDDLESMMVKVAPLMGKRGRSLLHNLEEIDETDQSG